MLTQSTDSLERCIAAKNFLCVVCSLLCVVCVFCMYMCVVFMVAYSLMYIVVLVERVHQIAMDTTHGAVIACDVVGPYGVLLLQEGVGLLKLHEEQGEQLLEAGMSLRDEESFMGDSSTKRSILTLDWPSLEQVLTKLTCSYKSLRDII